MNKSTLRAFLPALVAVAFASSTALAFTPRAPAPIQPGSIHTEEAPAKAAPAKTAEHKPKEAVKEAAKPAEPHAAPVAAAPAPAPAAHAAPAPAPAAHAAPVATPPAAHAAPAPAPAPAPAAHAAEDGPVYPVEVLRALLEGNKRYVSGKAANPHADAARRAEVAQGQHPVAIIVSCSDSRVPPEVIFDQGVGDIFVVRTAGEVVDDVALGSIEYAVEHLHAKLIVVLGHERCGAVAATLAGGHAPGHIGSIVEKIAPAVEKGKAKEGDALTNCILANVKDIAEKIRTTEPIISEHVKDGVARVVGGYYDLDTGMVAIVYSPDLSL